MRAVIPRFANARQWPSGRFLVTTIVFTSVVAAGAGFLLDRAGSRSAQVAGAAQVTRAQASAQLQRDYQTAESDYFTYLNSRSQDSAAASAWWTSGLGAVDARRWAATSTSLQAGADSESRQVPFDLGASSSTGPAHDRLFPDAFFRSREAPSTELLAFADEENIVAGQWAKLASSYTAVLTLVAAALFLFGSALALFGRNRAIFAVVGIALVLSAVAWTAVITPGSPADASSTAARDYAQGVRDAALATTPGTYQAAIDDFSRAIAANPDNGKAWERRADAELVRGSAAIGYGYVSQTQPFWLAQELRDEEQAYALGIRDEDGLSGLAFALYSTWLQQGGAGPPAQVLSLGQQVVQLDPSDPLGWFNLGLFQLAGGDFAAAQQSYRVGMEHVLYSDLPTRTPQSGNAFSLQQAWFAGAMSDLDNLATSAIGAQDPGLVSAVNYEKGTLAASIAEGTIATATTGASLASLTVPSSSVTVPVRNPNSLLLTFPPPPGWDATTPARNLSDQPTALVWYQRPTPVAGAAAVPWTAVAEIAHWGSNGSGPLQFLQSDHVYGLLDEYLQEAQQCLPNAEYRADVYAGGHLILSATAPARNNGNLVARYQGDIGLGVCVPADWQPVAVPAGTLSSGGNAGSNHALSSIYYGVQAPGGGQGVDLLRLYPSRDGFVPPPTGGPDAAAKALADLVDGTIEAGVELLKTGSSTAVALPPDLQATQQGLGQCLANFANVQEIDYTSASTGAEVRACGGTTGDDAVVIGIVYGPGSAFDPQSTLTDPRTVLDQVFYSFGPPS